MSAVEWLVIVILGLSTLFNFSAMIGLYRFRDVYARLHAAGKSSTGGVIMSMSAAFLYFLFVQDQLVLKFLLVIGFVFLTQPIVTIIVARSALHTRVPLDNCIRHDLHELYEREGVYRESFD